MTSHCWPTAEIAPLQDTSRVHDYCSHIAITLRCFAELLKYGTLFSVGHKTYRRNTLLRNDGGGGGGTYVYCW